MIEGKGVQGGFLQSLFRASLPLYGAAGQARLAQVGRASRIVVFAEDGLAVCDPEEERHRNAEGDQQDKGEKEKNWIEASSERCGVA